MSCCMCFQESFSMKFKHPHIKTTQPTPYTHPPTPQNHKHHPPTNATHHYHPPTQTLFRSPDMVLTRMVGLSIFNVRYKLNYIALWLCIITLGYHKTVARLYFHTNLVSLPLCGVECGKSLHGVFMFLMFCLLTVFRLLALGEAWMMAGSWWMDRYIDGFMVEKLNDRLFNW